MNDLDPERSALRARLKALLGSWVVDLERGEIMLAEKLVETTAASGLGASGEMSILGRDLRGRAARTQHLRVLGEAEQIILDAVFRK